MPRPYVRGPPLDSDRPAQRNTWPRLAESAAADRDTSRATLSSVRNAARVLRAFSRAGQELGITELSRQLGLGKSTVHRLVTTLTAERLLERGQHPRPVPPRPGPV